MDQSSPAPTATPRTIRRLDYTPPDFRVSHLGLDFDLEPNATIVKTKLKLERSGAADAPLVLNGRKLELISVALDGRALKPDDYQVDAEHLTIPGVGTIR